MTRTSKRLTARAAARHRQAKANEDQRHRERTELEHATEFEVARMRRDGAAATVVEHELAMARQVQTLLALGNPASRVAELTGETEAEIKRLRKLLDGRSNRASRLCSASNDDGRRRSPIRPPTDAEQLAPSHLATDSLAASPSDSRDPRRLAETDSVPSSD